MKAVHVGAGNIGRGFIGLLLHEAGYELVFADVADALITRLQEADSYQVRTVGQHPTTTVVDGFTAINSSQDPDVLAAQIAEADVVTTAVGAHILRFVAPDIAAGIAARPATSPRLAVMACENAINATDLLEQEIRANYSGDDLEDKALFSNTAVDRIVPVQAEDAGLDVTVEDFSEWAVERGPFDGQEPDVPGITWVDDLGPYIERKLFTVNTGHATTAWHGWRAGHARIAEAIADPSVAQQVEAVLGETSALLVAKHGFTADDMAAYRTKVLARFANEALPDPVERVGRAPLRKLSRHDRIIGPAAELAERGLGCEGLLACFAAALAFTPDGDEEADRLQEILRGQDADAATEEITGLDASHPLFAAARERVAARQRTL
ncbi:mannitol-1-phosphate 5-dehydrogenase [Brachybacterium sp. P6-10-X1]|uniref:mannitol-1-phosphate 5-dehydrogenase n=1 Tax=Brachybacterium sp. P6-10-X1 TaxID=1903186 RepID=UPI000971B681|nr:mannitol-1-phosphate 5-dehydrogenase [Brachybacterium sp. P6-10-X1]APX35021.1 mannitol-1-phosphate 5-dehydrogenase [Brachybacterium sp. P6-10-X1]